MIYIDKNPNPSGAYPNPKSRPFSGCVTLTEEQAAVFFAYNGFVTITQDDSGVVVAPNVEAWEEWKAKEAAKPTPEPEEELSVWDELDAAYREGVNGAYDQ